MMKLPSIKRPVLSAIAAALCGTAFATMPVAGWKGNFSAAAGEVNAVYLIPNGNSLVENGKAMAIDAAKGFYLSAKESATSWPETPATVVAAVKNVPTGKPILTAGSAGNNSRFGMMLNGSNKLSGIWQSNEYTGVTPTIEVTSATDAIKYFGYAYDQATGSLVAYDGQTQAMEPLKNAGNNIQSFTLGSLYADTPATGAEYSAVFFFRTALTAEELAKWTTAPVTELEADRHVELGADATVDASLSVLSLEITAPLKLTIGANAALTAEGGVFANSKLTMEIDCANRTTGWLVKGAIAGDVEWTLANAPTGAQAVRMPGGLFYYDADIHQVISVNFGNKGSATADSGLFKVAAGGWANTLAPASGTKSNLTLGYSRQGAFVNDTASSAVGVSWSSGGLYYWTSATDVCLKGYLDDGSGVSVTLTDIPFATYDLYVYAATDTDNRYFEPVTVAAYGESETSGVRYTADASGEAVADADGLGRWGCSRGLVPQLGRNVLRVPNLTGANLKLTTAKVSATYARACIAAVQVVDRSPATLERHEIKAELTADSTWSQLPWSETIANWSAQTDACVYLINRGTEPVKVTVDTPVSVQGVILQGSGDIILEDGATPNLSSTTAIAGPNYAGTFTRRWTGDLGTITFANLCAKQPVTGIPNNRLAIDIAGTAVTSGDNGQTIPVIVTGSVASDTVHAYVARATSALFWVQEGGTFTANGLTGLGQQNTSELRITGGTFTAGDGGYMRPNGGYSGGNYAMNISDGGRFDVPFTPYLGGSVTMGTTFKIKVTDKGSVFAPKTLTTSRGDDIATYREGSNYRITLIDNGAFDVPVQGVPNWLPVYATQGTGKIAVQEPETAGDLTLYCDLITTEGEATGNVSLDTGVKNVTLAGAWRGEGALTKLGTGRLDLGTARPKLAGVTGTLKLTATDNDLFANMIQLPAAGDLSTLTTDRVSVVDGEGEAVELAGVSYDAENAMVTIQFAARVLDINASTNLTTALGDNTYDRVYLRGGDTPDSIITVTIDCNLPAGTEFVVRGNVQFAAADGFTVPYGSLVYESGAVVTATEVPTGWNPIPSGLTLRLIGGTEEAPLAVGALEVSAGATLEVASGTVTMNGSQIIKGTVIVDPSATLKLMATDLIDYTSASVVFKVYGTLDLGTWRQSVREVMRFHFYAGSTVRGYGDQCGAIDCYHAAHTESMQFHPYDGAATQTVNFYATFRPRDVSVRLNIDDGVTLCCHPSSNGTSTRPLVYDKYGQLSKAGGGKLVLVGQELIPYESSFPDNAWNDRSLFSAVFSNATATAGTTLAGISYDANSVVRIDADRTVYVDKNFALPNNVHVTNGATLIFGHNDYNATNNRNIVEGSRLEIDEGSAVYFGYWADYVQGYAELPSVTINGAGLWGLYHEHASYLKVRGTVAGTATLDLNESSSGKIKVVTATGAINTPIKKTKGKSHAVDTASEPGMLIYRLYNAGLMIFVG